MRRLPIATAARGCPCAAARSYQSAAVTGSEGRPEASIQHVSQTELRGGVARFSGKLKALAREGKIPRTHAPVHIDRADDAVRLVDAVTRGFVEPSQRLVRIGFYLEPARKQRLRVLLREFGVARRGCLAPLRDASAERAVQEHESEAVLRHGVAAAGRLPVPIDRLGEIALHPLAFDVKLRDPERRFARTGRRGGPPAPERGDESFSGIGHLPAVHETRGAHTPDRRNRRETGCENDARHGSRIASPTP